MPTGNRTLKGNKRRATFNRLIVPLNGYQLPPDPKPAYEPDLPDSSVGQRVRIKNIILYEISLTYEGTAQKVVTTIPFGLVIGSPITTSKIAEGYQFVTSQGETILVQWHLNSTRWRQGLKLTNIKAEGTSWYEPNWGNIYGVGLEWISCDSTMEGTIWANRHMGDTSYTVDTESVSVNLYDADADKDYSKVAIRPGLMLGNPEPDRTLYIMGKNLPMRVFPALGEIGRGCIFGFNRNVLDNVWITPPLPATISQGGIANVRTGDFVSIPWSRNEFTTSTYLAVNFISGSDLCLGFNGTVPTDGSLISVSSPSTAISGSTSLTGGSWKVEAGTVVMDFLLLDSTTDDVVASNRVTINFDASGSAGSVTMVPGVVPALDECGNPIEVGQ